MNFNANVIYIIDQMEQISGQIDEAVIMTATGIDYNNLKQILRSKNFVSIGNGIWRKKEFDVEPIKMNIQEAEAIMKKVKEKREKHETI